MAHAYKEDYTTEQNYISPHPITPGEAIRTTLLNRVSWGAVFAGVVMAFSVQIILNMVGLGTGLLAMEFVEPPSGSSNSNIPIGAALWWTLSWIISAGVGGLTAGRLSGEPKISTAGWHGLISWAASLILLTMLMSTAAGVFAASPYQLVINRNNAYISSEYADGVSSSTPVNLINPSASSDTLSSPDGTLQNGQAAVDKKTASMAALISALALILGALAAWFSGRIGAVARNPEI